MKMNGRPGFTLIELMVVLTILGVLMAIGIPVVSSIMPDYRLRKASADLRSNLQLAKITSVRRNEVVVAVFTPGVFAAKGGVGSYKVFIDSNRDWTENDSLGNPEEVVIPTVTMPPAVSLTQTLFTDNGNGLASATQMVGFTSHGLVARSAAGAFVFGNVRMQNTTGKTAVVDVSPAGKIAVN